MEGKKKITQRSNGSFFLQKGRLEHLENVRGRG